jgi:NADPH2:quinone reductase
LLIADKLPAILSKDVVGAVSQVGDGVTAFKIGDRVMSLGSGAVADSSQSGLQEFALADVVNCAKIPDNISDEEAVCLLSEHHTNQHMLTVDRRRLFRPMYPPRS